MEELLRELIADLASIAEQHQEINDTPVEESMSEAIFNGYLKPAIDCKLPTTFGMCSSAGDARVADALNRFLGRARILADNAGLTFQDRLAAFQNRDVTFGNAQFGYNDFFRSRSPKHYDEFGNSK